MTKFAFLQLSPLEKSLLQFRAFAINRAVVVLPTPLIPVSKYAFGVLLSLIALVIVCAITS